MDGAALRPTLAKPQGEGRKRGPDLSVLVETTVVGVFGLVAVATAHEHWLKDRQDVMAITGPLNAWIDQLPAKTLKKIEKNLAPTLFVVGIATVVAPDVVVEMRIRNEEKRHRLAVPQPEPGSASGRSFRNPAAVGVAHSNGHSDGLPRSEGGWNSSIPANGPIGFEVDV